MNDLKRSYLHRPWAICLVVAIVTTVSASTAAWSQEDITDSALPHTADSVIFEWYNYYAPENVSNNTFGLYYGSWHSGDIRTEELFPHWVQIDLGIPHAVVQLNILAFSENPDFNLRLKDFRFEGSNNGVDFTPIHQDDLQYANLHEWQTFLFENSIAYQFYRLIGLNNWVDPDIWYQQMIIEEWEMFVEGGVSAEQNSWGHIKSLFR